MSRSLGTNPAELAQVLCADIVAREVQHGVLQGTGVSVTENETITINPSTVFARVVHKLAPQQVSHGSASHGSSRMSRVGSLGLIGRNGANGIDAEEFSGEVAHRDAVVRNEA